MLPLHNPFFSPLRVYNSEPLDLGLQETHCIRPALGRIAGLGYREVSADGCSPTAVGVAFPENKGRVGSACNELSCLLVLRVICMG